MIKCHNRTLVQVLRTNNTLKDFKRPANSYTPNQDPFEFEITGFHNVPIANGPRRSREAKADKYGRSTLFKDLTISFVTRDNGRPFGLVSPLVSTERIEQLSAPLTRPNGTSVDSSELVLS